MVTKIYVCVLGTFYSSSHVSLMTTWHIRCDYHHFTHKKTDSLSFFFHKMEILMVFTSFFFLTVQITFIFFHIVSP